MRSAYRRDLGRQVNILRNLHLASLQRALEVDVANLLAQIRLSANKSDKAVLDSQQDVGALLDPLLDLALCVDDQLLATINRLVRCV